MVIEFVWIKGSFEKYVLFFCLATAHLFGEIDIVWAPEHNIDLRSSHASSNSTDSFAFEKKKET